MLSELSIITKILLNFKHIFLKTAFFKSVYNITLTITNPIYLKFLLDIL